VSRNTVRKYLQVSVPVRRESRARAVTETVSARIEALLEQWVGRSPAKQRLTGSRLHQELVEEGFRVGVTTVRTYLRERRRRAAEVFVALVHRPGEGQVDFFEVTVEVGGERRKAWKFLLRLMYSGRDFVWLYDRCDWQALSGALPLGEGLDRPLFLPGWAGEGRLDGRRGWGDTRWEKERQTWTGTNEHRLARRGKGPVSRSGWHLPRIVRMIT
jgi:hypothetical protein